MLKTEWIFCGIWLIAGLGMLRCYLSRKRPLRSALLGMLTGAAALLIFSPIVEMRTDSYDLT